MIGKERQDRPKRPFRTDGCSGGMSWVWRRIAGGPPPWESACVEHDYDYWLGGSKEDRLQADKDLARRVAWRGHPTWAALIYWSVRIGGSPLLPFPWRWDYGRPWNPLAGYREAPDPEEFPF